MAEKHDLLRILISTDNHLGVWEKDEVRGDDSFNTLDEILGIAKREKVDFVLLGGDLFHDNKPSRQTVVKAMEIFSRHCLSDDPVGFRVLSDQCQNFASRQVNFENANYNIGLPVFTIHGNHDDPGGAENLSAVDILSTACLLNYFGKVAISGEGVGKVRISPVLIEKGTTKLAMFGLGNLRDERLCRLFQTPACVEWVRPAETPDYPKEDWFNLFVLHQNRVPHSQGAKNYVREGHLARFLDLVVWGHEHECLADPWDSVEAGGSFSVMQPGSSVATALSEGEAKRKHVVVLEVMGQHWRTIKHPLDTVRPFEFGSVTLAGQKKLQPDDPEAVTAFLEERVASMIKQAERRKAPTSPQLPLARLRVDYTGFSTINTQRFGARFVGRVANPHDIILWQKPPVKRSKEEIPARSSAPTLPPRPEALDEAHIEDLVAQHLQHDLELLPEAELAEALHEFVDKDNKNALAEAVGRVLQETQAAAAEERVAVGSSEATAAAHHRQAGVKDGSPMPAPGSAKSPAVGRKGAAPLPSTVKPEESEVLDSIASATARRRAIHGMEGVSSRARNETPNPPQMDLTTLPGEQAQPRSEGGSAVCVPGAAQPREVARDAKAHAFPAPPSRQRQGAIPLRSTSPIHGRGDTNSRAEQLPQASKDPGTVVPHEIFTDSGACVWGLPSACPLHVPQETCPRTLPCIPWGSPPTQCAIACADGENMVVEVPRPPPPQPAAPKRRAAPAARKRRLGSVQASQASQQQAMPGTEPQPSMMVFGSFVESEDDHASVARPPTRRRATTISLGTAGGGVSQRGGLPPGHQGW